MAPLPNSWTSFSRRLKPGPWPEEVTDRLQAALDALVRRARAIDSVAALVLFGSYARGDFGRKSDVDLLVLVHPAGAPGIADARAEVVRAVIEAETEFRLPMHLAALVASASAPEELGPDLLHALWAEGVILFAEASVLAALQPTGLAPWAIVRFSAAGLPAHHGVRVSRRLHGRGRQPGLLRSPAIRLGRGAVLLPPEQARTVHEALDEIGVTQDVIPVWRPV